MSEEQTYLGAYRITGTLGQGAFGVVYQAYQPFLDRQVAIKTLQRAYVADPAQEQQFMREARTIARLRHNNIVSVYEFATTPHKGQSLTYMVMEYLPGETLDDRLKKHGRLSVVEAVNILERLAAALDYAHSHHVIHRDLKPANILFNEADEPVIVDFGLAKLAALAGSDSASTENPQESTLAGTPAYMAPEQVASIEITPAVDQYALAVIAFQMLSGRFPFDMSQPVGQILADRLQGMPMLLKDAAPEYDERVSNVLERALMIYPENRYPSAGEFVRELAKALLPERESSRVVMVIDPVQAALLRAARQTIAGLMWGALGYVLTVLILMIALVATGYQSSSPVIFAWDGIVAGLQQEEGGWRTVLDTWPGSPAARAGILPGDRINGDLRLEVSRQDGLYSINGRPRSAYRAGFQPGEGDVIERVVERNGQTMTVTYTLEASPYPLLILLLTVPASLLYLAVAAWLLWRWGAEPGLQVFFVLLLFATLFIGTSVTLDMYPIINLTVSALLTCASTHIMLIFPQPLPFVQRHPRLPWLLYAPVILPGLLYLSGNRLATTGLNLIPLLLLLYTLAYTLLLIFKWWRIDRPLYPGMNWLIAAMGLIIINAILSIVLIGLAYSRAASPGISGNVLLLSLFVIRFFGAMFIAPLAGYGYHRIQSAMGPSLPPDDGAMDSATVTSIAQSLFPAASLKSTGGKTTTERAL